ncbi:MAG: tetratricopeptide repeat protein, partial [Pirellulaceae bacterium]
DLANVDASIDWLDKRLVQGGGTERWRPHAYYLLGRCFEEKGDLPKAAEYYKGENLPQEAGNRIRLRLLERQPLAEPSLPN